MLIHVLCLACNMQSHLSKRSMSHVQDAPITTSFINAQTALSADIMLDPGWGLSTVLQFDAFLSLTVSKGL